jgi:hypothetical protein
VTPRRPMLAATAAALLTLVVAGCTGRDPAPKPALPTASSSPAMVTSAEPDLHNDGFEEASDAPPAPQALAVADAYVRAWARPDLDAAEWLAAITAYATPQYGGLLATVDPSRVPARRVTGPPVAVSSTTVVVVIDVPTNTGAVRVTCTNTAGRWLVATVDPPGPFS